MKSLLVVGMMFLSGGATAANCSAVGDSLGVAKSEFSKRCGNAQICGECEHVFVDGRPSYMCATWDVKKGNQSCGAEKPVIEPAEIIIEAEPVVENTNVHDHVEANALTLSDDWSMTESGIRWDGENNFRLSPGEQPMGVLNVPFYVKQYGLYRISVQASTEVGGDVWFRVLDGGTHENNFFGWHKMMVRDGVMVVEVSDPVSYVMPIMKYTRGQHMIQLGGRSKGMSIESIDIVSVGDNYSGMVTYDGMDASVGDDEDSAREIFKSSTGKTPLNCINYLDRVVCGDVRSNDNVWWNTIMDRANGMLTIKASERIGSVVVDK